MAANVIIDTYKKSFSGLSRETWLLSVVMMINRGSYMAVPFMGLYVTQYLARPTSDAGLIITIFGIGSILGQQRAVNLPMPLVSGLFRSGVPLLAVLCLYFSLQ